MCYSTCTGCSSGGWINPEMDINPWQVASHQNERDHALASWAWAALYLLSSPESLVTTARNSCPHTRGCRLADKRKVGGLVRLQAGTDIKISNTNANGIWEREHTWSVHACRAWSGSACRQLLSAKRGGGDYLTLRCSRLGVLLKRKTISSALISLKPAMFISILTHSFDTQDSHVRRPQYRGNTQSRTKGRCGVTTSVETFRISGYFVKIRRVSNLWDQGWRAWARDDVRSRAAMTFQPPPPCHVHHQTQHGARCRFCRCKPPARIVSLLSPKLLDLLPTKIRQKHRVEQSGGSRLLAAFATPAAAFVCWWLSKFSLIRCLGYFGPRMPEPPDFAEISMEGLSYQIVSGSWGVECNRETSWGVECNRETSWWCNSNIIFLSFLVRVKLGNVKLFRVA